MPVLDATAIGVSLVRSDFNTAGSIMFLLGIGELLEEWTHKKSVDDLARSMSLNVTKVWKWMDGKEELVSAAEIRPGSQVVVHMGNVIPFDGKMTAGEAMVNQASLTGESVPVRKETGMFVYAGTVVEEGEMTLEVTEVGASRRFQKIVSMIEESEKLKSGLECKAENLANKLVPYSFARYGPYLPAHRKCCQSLVCSYGRLFLCSETGDADFCFVGYPGGQSLRGNGKRR